MVGVGEHNQSSRRRPNFTSSSVHVNGAQSSSTTSSAGASTTTTSSSTATTSPHSTTKTFSMTAKDEYPSDHALLFRTNSHSLNSHNNNLNNVNNNNHHNNRTNKTFKPSSMRRGGIIVYPILSLTFVGCIVTMLGLWFVFLLHVVEHRREYHVHFFHGLKWHPQQNSIRNNHNNPYCQFRRYPPHRYYQLTRPQHEPQPAFLTTDTEYIFGEWPVLLQPLHSKETEDAGGPTKLCVDQSEWLSSSSSSSSSSVNKDPNQAGPIVWPFADGTNPSILTLHRLQHWAPSVARQITQAFPTAHVLVTLCMTNSQCTWRDSESMRRENHYDLPNLQQTEPNTVRTILQILDADYQVLTATTILLHRDAAWGKQFPQSNTVVNPNNKNNNKPMQMQMHMPALDDARLFVHAQQIMVSYREGPGFGYETQVLNPVHLEFSFNHNNNNNAAAAARHTVPIPMMTATLRASETMSVCCGRNMALLNVLPVDDANAASPAQPPLLALTWVDPVTVETVDTTPLIQQQQRRQPPPKSRTKPQPKQRQRRRRLMTESLYSAKEDQGEDATTATAAHRWLKEQQKQPQSPTLRKPVHKSHIHGTNAFMLPLPSTSGKMEYLGVAHFHRPNDRKPNPYARFGHHYTHAFYRVERQPQRVERQPQLDGSSPNNSQWHLTGLSPEFVLPSAMPAQRDDAEIIQFVSGLDLLGDGTTLVLAYGINDCEAALTTVSLAMVLEMLRDIRKGTQVVDYMQPLSSPN